MTLAELEQQRRDIPDDSQLPAATTLAELQAIHDRRATLDGRIARAKVATAELAAVRTDNDEKWLVELNIWRTQLCDEYMTFKSPLRDKALLARARNLEDSINYIDKGLSKRAAAEGRVLESMALGDLMRASGYVQAGADPQHNYAGTLPWGNGSIRDVSRRIAEYEQRRATAEASLQEALMDEADRAARDAEAKQLRDAYNKMRTKVGGHGLVVVSPSGDPIDERTLTPLQQKALARAREAWEPVGS